MYSIHIFLYTYEHYNVSGTKGAGYNRMRFLLESLQDLDKQLQAVGGRLYVFVGDLYKTLEHLFQVSSYLL